MADRVFMFRALDTNGDIVSGAVAYFYDSGTTTPLTVYSDSGATVPLGVTVQSDSSGTFVPIYTTTSPRVDVRDADGVSLPGFPSDDWYVTPSTGLGASTITFSPIEGNPSSDVQSAIQTLTLLWNAVTTYGKSLMAAADAAAARVVLGLGNAAVQGWSTSSDFTSFTGQATSRGAIATYVGTRLPTLNIIALGSLDATATPAWTSQAGFSATVIDNGTGDYTIAFDAAEPDVNYSVSLAANSDGDADKRLYLSYSTPTVNGFGVLVVNANGTAIDPDAISVIVTRA